MNEWFLKELDELGEIYIELLQGTQDGSESILDDAKDKRLGELVCEIIDFMIDSPGTMIFVKDKSKRNFYEKVIDFSWKTIDAEQIIDRLFSSENEKFDLLIGDFSNRVKRLKPIIISVNPIKSEYTSYLEEAMSAWLYGLNNAALILCFSVLENVLKDRLCQINIDYVFELRDPTNPKGVQTVSFDKIIKSAFREKLISFEHKEGLFDIKKKRNDSTHELMKIKSEEVYDIILKTKDIIEHLLGGN